SFLSVLVLGKKRVLPRSRDCPGPGTCNPTWPPAHSYGSCLVPYRFRTAQSGCSGDVFLENKERYGGHRPSWWNHPTSLSVDYLPALQSEAGFPAAVPRLGFAEASIRIGSGI